MHELGMAASILEAVRAEAAPRAPARPVKVGIRVGGMAGVDRDSLSFCFEALVKDSELAGLALDIEPAFGDELELSYLELEE